MKFSLASLPSLLAILALACGSPLPAQPSPGTYCPAPEQARLDSILAQLRSDRPQGGSPGELAARVGQYFLGRPYVARTLEIEGEEQLVVCLSGLDCTTFLENTLAFTALLLKDSLDAQAYARELERIRYRGGRRGGYPSRLHYFTDWIYEQEQAGRIENLSQRIGGVPYQKTIDFMSTHRSSYAQLADEATWQQIREAELRMNQRPGGYYLPKQAIRAQEHLIRSGDLIAITTQVAGLDVSHVGLALQLNGRLHLLHASSLSKQVEISPEPLAEYMAGKSSQTGIIVCRLR
jgi:hypothetical protein